MNQVKCLSHFRYLGILGVKCVDFKSIDNFQTILNKIFNHISQNLIELPYLRVIYDSEVWKSVVMT